MRRPLLVTTTALLLVLTSGGVVAQDGVANASAITVAQRPIADYWTEWTDHKTFYRDRVRFAIRNAQRTKAKLRFYRKLVAVHADELARLRNHRPAACYAGEYERWRAAVLRLKAVHTNALRALGKGNRAAFRRAVAAQKPAMKRLNRVRAVASSCADAPPGPVPPGNPFVGKWETRDNSVLPDGFYDNSRTTMRIRSDGTHLTRDPGGGFCRINGVGYVPISLAGKGTFTLGMSSRYDWTSGKVYCYPRSGGRVAVAAGLGGFYQHDRAADVLLGGSGTCLWRSNDGSAKDCKRFWRGPTP